MPPGKEEKRRIWIFHSTTFCSFWILKRVYLLTYLKINNISIKKEKTKTSKCVVGSHSGCPQRVWFISSSEHRVGLQFPSPVAVGFGYTFYLKNVIRAELICVTFRQKLQKPVCVLPLSLFLPHESWTHHGTAVSPSPWLPSSRCLPPPAALTWDTQREWGTNHRDYGIVCYQASDSLTSLMEEETKWLLALFPNQKYVICKKPNI